MVFRTVDSSALCSSRDTFGTFSEFFHKLSLERVNSINPNLLLFNFLARCVGRGGGSCSTPFRSIYELRGFPESHELRRGIDGLTGRDKW